MFHNFEKSVENKFQNIYIRNGGNLRGPMILSSAS